MSNKKFTTVDYEAALVQTVSLREALPASHLARFVVDVRWPHSSILDSPTPGYCSPSMWGCRCAPTFSWCCRFNGHATGMFQFVAHLVEAPTRCCPSIRRRWAAPGSRRSAELPIYVPGRDHGAALQVLLLAQAAGYLTFGNISINGSRWSPTIPTAMPSPAATSACLSCKSTCGPKWSSCFGWPTRLHRHASPDGMNVVDAIALRQERLARLAEAKQVLQARAQERRAAEQAEYELEQRVGEAQAQRMP